MKFFRDLNQFMVAGARAHARWELEMSNNILKSRKRLLVLGLLLIPVFLGGIAFADPGGTQFFEFGIARPAGRGFVAVGLRVGVDGR